MGKTIYMKSIDPKSIPTKELHQYLLSAVSPRPIGFISTTSKNGVPNLAPFSFFNVFSANPPIMIFSPARRVRDNTIKDTLVNCQDTKEAVINIVDFDMVQQMSLASSDFDSEVDEFVKAGFTPLDSDEIKPLRVAESPVQFECKITEIQALGKEGGAGNLIIAEVVKLHVRESVLNEKGLIDPLKLDVVARMGGPLYSRALEGIFQIPKPLTHVGIGFDQLPEEVLTSSILSKNDLAVLAGIDKKPTTDIVDKFIGDNPEFKSSDSDKKHKFVLELIARNEANNAWCVLLQ